MSIPIATTTIELLSAELDDATEDAEDWGDTGDYVHAGGPIRAHLSAPGGAAAVAQEGSSTSVTFRLLADPCDMKPGMRVKDLETGVTYEVDWCQPRTHFIPYVVAGVVYREGTS